jgi:nucleoside-diphosphate-sugar epimerase
MKVLVTGAGGFIGTVLLQLLQQAGQVGGQPITGPGGTGPAIAAAARHG